MPGRKNRKDKYGTGVHLNQRERDFVLAVFEYANGIITFDPVLHTVHYPGGFLNGYTDIFHGLVTRGMLKQVLPTPTIATGDLAYGLTEKGRAAWAVATSLAA